MGIKNVNPHSLTAKTPSPMAFTKAEATLFVGINRQREVCGIRLGDR